MGNQLSIINDNKLKPKMLSQHLDYIATNYILTMDFKSLRELYKPEYCNNLVILTSDILQRYYTELEVTYLAQRLKHGETVNEHDTDNIIFFDKNKLLDHDIKSSIKKKRICQSIAKFYVKIAHIFAAIATTINPVIVYKNEENEYETTNIFGKDKIPINAERSIEKINICENRINSLKNGQNILNVDDNDKITIGPKMCDINISSNNEYDKTIFDEPGIPELMELYYDDDYNYETGQFNNMSPETKQQFQHDLTLFYNIFTGKSDMPENIKQFSDIKLYDYHNLEKCDFKHTSFNGEQLFQKYADNLKMMINTTKKNQHKLLQIINQIFVYTIDPQTNKKHIRVSPSLTDERLQHLVGKTRELIVELYLTCEIDYVNGLKIYEAIVENKILETTQKQIQKLESLSDDLMKY